MMRDFSMHILDIAQNSIVAEAKNIVIEINENPNENVFSFTITDDGKGMSEQFLENVKNPFTTSRTTRKVGLGIPMLSQTCTVCGGDLLIKSVLGDGTELYAYMEYDNIDRPPIGDIISTMHVLIVTTYGVDIRYIHKFNEKTFCIDTKEIKEALGEDVNFTEPLIMQWIHDNIKEGLEEIKS